MDAWHRNWSWGAIPPPGGTPQRARYFLGHAAGAVPLHLRGLYGPSAGWLLILGGKKWQKFALFYPLWCKATGEWGGSAHYPDPTAQSVAVAIGREFV